MSTPRERRDVYSTRRWRALRARVLAEAGRRCADCGRGGADTVHHLDRLRAGGDPWDRGRLIALCRRCHRRRHLDEAGPLAAARREYDAELRRRTRG